MDTFSSLEKVTYRDQPIGLDKQIFWRFNCDYFPNSFIQTSVLVLKTAITYRHIFTYKQNIIICRFKDKSPSKSLQTYYWVNFHAFCRQLTF